MQNNLSAECRRIVTGRDLHEVQTVLFNWFDKAREREVPAKAYYPVNCAGKSPLVIFSHGLGGTRQGYEYLGRFWAGCGFVTVHVQHRGSDNETGRNNGRPSVIMKQAAADPANLVNRPRDVTFAINRMQELSDDRTSPFSGRLDLGRIGVAGHSFGGYTAQAACGRAVAGPAGVLDLSDARLAACIAISAPAKDTSEFRQSFQNFSKPCLHITGVHDTSPIGETKVEHRRLPYDSIPAGGQYLVIFRDADHMVFTGKIWPGRDAAIDGEIHRLVQAGTVLFWNAYLNNDSTARSLLSSGGLESLFHDKASVEIRPR